MLNVICDKLIVVRHKLYVRSHMAQVMSQKLNVMSYMLKVKGHRSSPTVDAELYICPLLEQNVVCEDA